jgi:hypothetical protein
VRSFWAVTSYFNPCRYRRRLENYRRFRERLPVPLLAVELSHDGGFELGAGDADIVVRRRAEDVLWQKERLLNIGIAALPPHCDKVAWLDADVLLARDDWHDAAADLLENRAMVQLFDRFTDLPRDRDRPEANAKFGDGFVFLHARGDHEQLLYGRRYWTDLTPVADGTVRVARRASSGFAWAARRDVLGPHGLYDGCVAGSGDRAIACAALGRAVSAKQNFLRNDAQRRHYLAWAVPFGAAVDGRVSYVEGDLHHLWHGELRDRGWRERWDRMDRFGFDPTADIAIDGGGCWRWNSRKPEMHAYLADYFASRREDGA